MPRFLRWSACLSAALAVVAIPATTFAYKGGKVEDGGSISGKLTFSGKKPAAKKLPVTKDHQVCGQAKHSQELIVGGGGELKNVVVYIKKIKAGKKAKKSTVVLDQKTCVYEPHVQGAIKGSKIELRNSDPILHNVHGEKKKNIVFNVAMPTKGQKIKQKLRSAGLVKVSCDAGHTWMSAYIHVFKHPYYAVTGTDGTFSLDDVPPGKYTLVAWHEKLGEKKAKVTVSAGGKAVVNFDFR